MGITERIREIEFEMARTQKNKATEYHLGLLKARLAKLRSQLLDAGSKGAVKGEGFDVVKLGNARVAMVGFPSVGKSSLLCAVTDTASKTAAYEFTTLTCIPGMINYKDCKIQLLDLPGIIEGASQGKGKGKQVIGVAKASDMILMVVEASKFHEQTVKLTRELEAVGIRLNRKPPNVVLKKKKMGGVAFTSTVPLTHMNERLAKTILQEYKMHNVDLIIKEDITVDEFIDVIEGNRSYIKCLYVLNKIDMLSMEDLADLAKMDNTVLCSVEMKINLEYLIQRLWEKLALVRVYTKRKGFPPDFSDPIVLAENRHGFEVKAICDQIHRDLAKEFKSALVWGRSVKYSPMTVGLRKILDNPLSFLGNWERSRPLVGR